MISKQNIRMRWSFWIVLSLVAGVSAQDTQLRQSYTSEEINDDLDRMQQILISMHPGLHLYITPEDLEKEFAAIHKGDPTNDLIAIKYLESLEKVAEGNATKIFLPADLSATLGSIGAISELFKDEKSGESDESVEESDESTKE